MRAVKKYLPWVLCALFLIVAVTFGLLWRQERTRARAEDELRAQATAFIGDLTSISAETAEADAARIKAWAVGDFAEEADVFYGDRAIDAVVEAQASTEGEIDELYVQSLREGQGSLFAVVSYTVTNAETSEPKTDTIRMSIEMLETGGDWKVSSVRVLESPGTTLPGGT